VFFLLGTTPPSASATGTRADYAAQVNPICAAADSQSAQLIEEFNNRKLKREKGKGSLKKFWLAIARGFTLNDHRLEGIEKAALSQIAQIPPAPGDEALVAQWVANLQRLVTAASQLNAVSERYWRLLAISDPRVQRMKLKHWRRAQRLLVAETKPLNDTNVEIGTQLGITSCN
jgi:hypothetical protein